MPNVVIPSGGLGVLTPGLISKYVNPAPPSSGIIYVSKGERWDAIAYKMYGDSTQVEPLIQNNPGIPIGDYVAAGVQVFVPLITPSTSTTSSTPWG
jgi:phage tail protein X